MAGGTQIGGVAECFRERHKGFQHVLEALVFNAFDNARMKFDVRFYLVAILFIIFDLEVAFLFPWSVAFKDIGEFGFWSMIVFLLILTVGFVYEWKKGALEWE